MNAKLLSQEIIVYAKRIITKLLEKNGSEALITAMSSFRLISFVWNFSRRNFRAVLFSSKFGTRIPVMYKRERKEHQPVTDRLETIIPTLCFQWTAKCQPWVLITVSLHFNLDRSDCYELFNFFYSFGLNKIRQIRTIQIVIRNDFIFTMC